MATNNKDFKVKHGLIVEGSNATVNGNQVLRENDSDQYIIDLIGGETLITSVESTQMEVVNGELNIKSGVFEPAGSIDALTTKDVAEDQDYLYFTDGRVKDVLTGATKTNIAIETIAGELHITAENGVADSTTDDLDEGTTNKYFTEQRARDSISGSGVINYDSNAGTIQVSYDTGLTNNNGKLVVDRTTVDGWYDAAGSASDVATDLSTHEQATTGVHGVTGNVVGTSDTQTLSNKTLEGSTSFRDSTGTYIGAIGDSDGDLVIGGENNLVLYSSVEDILLNPATGRKAYVGGVSAGNEIATNSYVDNAVSGLDWKQAVHLLYDAAIPVLSGSGASQLNVDNHGPLGDEDSGYRILLAAIGGASTDGIYVFNSTGGSWTLTRAADADAFEELVGAAVFVMEGTQYGQTSWVQSNHYLSSFSGQSWTQFSGSGSVVAGTGITVDGLEVSIDRTTVDTWYEPAGAIDALTTSDIEEGTNQYFTAQRAVDAAVGGDGVSVNATYLITAASGGVPFVDVNLAALETQLDNDGYAKTSDIPTQTSDLTEANGVLYFTDDRARTAVVGALGSGATYLEDTGSGYVDLKLATLKSALDTDDISEGSTNQYFTDTRAKMAVFGQDATLYDIFNSATTTNITASYIPTMGLTLTAENGVADSTTDDLTEGSTNKYFTDQRALDAVSGSDITPNSVTIDTYRKEEATQQYVVNASTVNVHSLPAGFESAKYIVRVVGSVAGTKHSQLTEILLTTDGNNNIAITEYGTICTDTNNLASFSATYEGGQYKLTATTAVNGCEVIAAATMLSWAD